MYSCVPLPICREWAGWQQLLVCQMWCTANLGYFGYTDPKLMNGSGYLWVISALDMKGNLFWRSSPGSLDKTQ